jgi:glycosyltransferase involved in cell wall biosynthesis
VLSSPPNEQAAERLARRVLPLVRPEAELVLVGRDPSPRVRALASLRGVSIVPGVPDLRPWLWSAAAYACPMLSGTGIKNKLLEAMAAGAPAVATTLGCRGLAVRDGEQLLVADDDVGLAAALSALLTQPELAARIAAGAHEYVRARHDWDAVAGAYARLYGEVAAEAHVHA